MADKSTRDGILELVKTAREVALKKSEINSKDIAIELVKAIREEVTGFESKIIQMRKLEQASVQKSLFGLPSTTPSDAEVKTKKSEFKAACKNCKTEMSPVEYVQSRPQGSCKKCASINKSELRKDQPLGSAPAPVVMPNHPVFNKGNYAVLSGENPKFPQQVQLQGGNQALENEFKTRGWQYEPIKGMYDQPENSFIVHNPDVAGLRDLGARLGQESVLLSNGGQNKLLFTNGPNAGKYNPGEGLKYHGATPPSNYFSTMTHEGKPVHWTNNIDFNQFLPYEENVGKSELNKSVFNLLGKQAMPNPGKTPSIIPGQPEAPQLAQSEPMIDCSNENNPEKREVDKHPNSKAKLPTDKKAKKIPAPGSGGQLKKEVMSPTAPMPKASGLNMKPPKATTEALKPSGVPGAKAGTAPGAPPPPTAPGATKPTFGKADELEKGFVKPVREGTKVQQQKEDLAWVGSHSSPAINHAQKKNPNWKPPTMEQHAQRASSFGDFMPPGKFGKV